MHVCTDWFYSKLYLLDFGLWCAILSSRASHDLRWTLKSMDKSRMISVMILCLYPTKHICLVDERASVESFKLIWVIISPKEPERSPISFNESWWAIKSPKWVLISLGSMSHNTRPSKVAGKLTMPWWDWLWYYKLNNVKKNHTRSLKSIDSLTIVKSELLLLTVSINLVK